MSCSGVPWLGWRAS